MQKGELRSKIMDECPEGFEEALADFIDILEDLTCNIVDELQINDISDIGKVEEAHRLADDLHDALY